MTSVGKFSCFLNWPRLKGFMPEKTPEKGVRDEMAPQAKPVIDEEACTGCGACVNICPEGVLELVGDVAKLAYSDRCTGCGTCEAECPVGAITLEE